MLQGIALFGICVVMALLMRWLVAYDAIPDGTSEGLFALRETKKKPQPNARE